MKTIFAILTVLALGFTASAQKLNADIKAAEPKTSQFLAVPLTTGSTVQATNGATKYTTATFYGYATLSATAAPVANTNATSIGFATQSTDGTHSVTNLVDSIAAGSSVTIKAPPGTKYDLADVYFKGTTGERIQIVYEQ